MLDDGVEVEDSLSAAVMNNYHPIAGVHLEYRRRTASEINADLLSQIALVIARRENLDDDIRCDPRDIGDIFRSAIGQSLV